MANPKSKILLVAVPKRIQHLFPSHRLSYVVSSAATGKEALALIETENIQLCILSDELPDMEEVIQKVRQTPWASELPILVITSTKTHEELFKLGADAFFGTAETDAQFLEKIELLLGLSDGNPTSDFSKRVDVDNAFHHALQYASQLVKGMDVTGTVEELRRLSSEQTLQSLVAEVDGELRGQLIGTTIDEIPEGLEAVEPKAYIGHQLSVGERMESDARDSSVDGDLDPLSTRESIAPDGLPSSAPITSAVNGDLGLLNMGGDRTSAQPRNQPLAKPSLVGNDSGDTLAQPFASFNAESKEQSTRPGFLDIKQPPEAFKNRVLTADIRAKNSGSLPKLGYGSPQRDDRSVDESVDVLVSDNSAPSSVQGGVEKRSIAPVGSAQPVGKPTGNRTENVAPPPSFEFSPPVKDGDPLEGQLQNVPLWQVFLLVVKKQVSARLWVQSRDIERQVFFENGTPVVVYSNAKKDRLVELLYREGRISQKQYENAAMTIAASGRRAGVVMVEKGIIAARELFPLVRYHYESILFDMFGWTDGSWKLMIEPYNLKERILLDSRVHDIVLDAFRTYVPTAQVQQLVGPESMVTVVGGEDFQHLIQLSAAERDLLEWCDGNRSVGWLAKRFSMDKLELQGFLAGMVALGWVHVDGIAAVDMMKLASSTMDGVIDSAKSSVEDEDDLDLNHETTRINEKYMQIEEGTYFDIAEVSPDASSYEIRKSLQRLKSLYAPKRYVGLQISDLQEKLSIIGFIFDEAGDVLFDEQRREQYRQAIM